MVALTQSVWPVQDVNNPNWIDTFHTQASKPGFVKEALQQRVTDGQYKTFLLPDSTFISSPRVSGYGILAAHIFPTSPGCA